MVHICTVGGGTGQASILQALQSLPNISSITGIVCTTDNGGSSAVVRESLAMPSPGDTRNCFNSINNDNSLLSELLQYRFSQGTLAGTHLGNLIVGALTDIYGSIDKTFEKLHEGLNTTTRVLPVSNESTNICATLEDGTIVTGERDIIKRKNPSIIKTFHLENSAAQATESVIQSLEKADLIIICPGVLGTAIISTLIHKGVFETIEKNTAAKIVYFGNMFTYPNQTDGMSMSDHIDQLTTYLPRSIDYLVVNTQEPPQEIVSYYASHNHALVSIDKENISDEITIFGGYFLETIDADNLASLERASNSKQHVGTHIIKADKERVSTVIGKILSL